MTPAEKLVNRLERCLPRGKGRWMACCPAHDDKSPSLSIRVNQQGGLLVHCFAGCSALDIMSAAGLGMTDLFPDDGYTHQYASYGQEKTVDWWRVELTKIYMSQGKRISESDKEEFIKAKMRIANSEDPRRY